MGRSVSYPSDATVVTFADHSGETCSDCEGTGTVDCGQCEGTGTTDAMGYEEECPVCDGSGTVDCDFDQLIEDFQQHLKTLFPSVSPADDWIGREDHVLAENRLARFGMSEYCGLVAYWIVPQGGDEYGNHQLSTRWIDSIKNKFVAAFGELPWLLHPPRPV